MQDKMFHMNFKKKNLKEVGKKFLKVQKQIISETFVWTNKQSEASEMAGRTLNSSLPTLFSIFLRVRETVRKKSWRVEKRVCLGLESESKSSQTWATQPLPHLIEDESSADTNFKYKKKKIVTQSRWKNERCFHEIPKKM